MSDLLKKAKFPPYPHCVDVAAPPVSDADTQPPQINSLIPPGPLRQYLKTLRERSEQKRLSYERAKALEQQRCKQQAQSKLVRQEPLEAQIQRWWMNLPPALQERPFQITEIARVCKGRYRDRPALREVAAALRILGWTQYRDWTVSGRNRRLWKPNHNPEANAQGRTCDITPARKTVMPIDTLLTRQ